MNALVTPAQGADCFVCGSRGRGTCSRCFQTWYCSIECQREDWLSQHHRTCAPDRVGAQSHSSVRRRAAEKLSKRAPRRLHEGSEERFISIAQSASNFKESVERTQIDSWQEKGSNAVALPSTDGIGTASWISTRQLQERIRDKFKCLGLNDVGDEQQACEATHSTGLHERLSECSFARDTGCIAFDRVETVVSSKVEDGLLHTHMGSAVRRSTEAKGAEVAVAEEKTPKAAAIDFTRFAELLREQRAAFEEATKKHIDQKSAQDAAVENIKRSTKAAERAAAKQIEQWQSRVGKEPNKLGKKVADAQSVVEEELVEDYESRRKDTGEERETEMKASSAKKIAKCIVGDTVATTAAEADQAARAIEIDTKLRRRWLSDIRTEPEELMKKAAEMQADVEEASLGSESAKVARNFDEKIEELRNAELRMPSAKKASDDMDSSKDATGFTKDGEKLRVAAVKAEDVTADQIARSKTAEAEPKRSWQRGVDKKAEEFRNNSCVTQAAANMQVADVVLKIAKATKEELGAELRTDSEEKLAEATGKAAAQWVRSAANTESAAEAQDVMERWQRQETTRASELNAAPPDTKTRSDEEVIRKSLERNPPSEETLASALSLAEVATAEDAHNDAQNAAEDLKRSGKAEIAKEPMSWLFLARQTFQVGTRSVSTDERSSKTSSEKIPMRQHQPESEPNDEAVSKIPDQAAVESWKKHFDAITSDCALWDEEADDVSELLRLCEMDVGRRCELAIHGDEPILVTAPHCITLLRDGDCHHQIEDHTAILANSLAKEFSGTSLMWTVNEQRRTELLWTLGQRDVGLLDPRNRDPNYLSTAEIHENYWFQQMQSWASSWKCQRCATLHVDLHGCKDPPSTPSHITIGLGAMMNRARQSGDSAQLKQLEIFSKALEEKLFMVLENLQLKPSTDTLVRVIGAETSGSHMKFTGAWPANSLRYTQTQQSVSICGVTHAIQIEMSRALRRALLQPGRIRELQSALIAAWEMVAEAPRCSRAPRMKVESRLLTSK